MTEADARIKKLEEALEDAEARAKRANVRARDADESYRKLQLDLVAAKDDLVAARKEVESLGAALAAEKERAAALEARASSLEAELARAQPKRDADGGAPREGAERDAQIEATLARITSLRELLATASIELSQLHADEVALGARRTRVLSDACTLLARAVGDSGEAPPPIPSGAPTLEARLSVAPSVDISEVAELIESLRPPAPPTIERPARPKPRG